MSENRCQRCRRVLKDVQAEYGWKCAEILGVTGSLNAASDKQFEAYQKGIRRAKQFLNNNEEIRLGSGKISGLHAAFAKEEIAEQSGNEKLKQLAQDEIYELLDIHTEDGPSVRRGGYPSLREYIEFGKEEEKYAINRFGKTGILLESDISELLPNESSQKEAIKSVVGGVTGLIYDELINDAELDLLFDFPIETGRAFDCSATATKVIKVLFQGMDEDGTRANAFKHAYWNAVMVYEMGEEWAEKFGTAHEIPDKDKVEAGYMNEMTNGFRNAEHIEMDLHNNIVGREIGASVPAKADRSDVAHNELIERLGSKEKIEKHMEEYKLKDEAHLLLLILVHDELEKMVWLAPE